MELVRSCCAALTVGHTSFCNCMHISLSVMHISLSVNLLFLLVLLFFFSIKFLHTTVVHKIA